MVADRLRGTIAAERLVVDQLADRGRRSADRARGIATDGELAKLESECVEQQQAALEGGTDAHEQFDGLERLNGADNTRQDPQNPSLVTRRHQTRGWWLPEQTAIARSRRSSEHRRLPVEAEDRAVHVRDAQQHARVVHEVPRWEVVTPVHDDIEATEEIERVAGREPVVERAERHVRVEVTQPRRSRRHFARPDCRCAVKHLALQVGLVEGVGIDDPERPHTGGGEVQQHR